MEALTLEILKKAIQEKAAALRCVTEYQPAGGPGDKIFPATYQGGQYALETRLVDDQLVNCVVIDSVQSQANRMELALLEDFRAQRIELPVIEARFEDEKLLKPFTITSLEAPHRIADAIFRDSYLKDEPTTKFRESEKGKILNSSDIRNATGLYGLCPTALIYGVWDSTGPRGGLGVKIQRAIVSEMVGVHAQEGCKTSSRIDPLRIQKGAGPVFRAADGKNWTLNPEEALEKNGKFVLWAKTKKGENVLWDPIKEQDEGNPSRLNHGNIPPSLVDSKTKQPLPGGFTIAKAIQTTTISLAAIRRLRFPFAGQADSIPEVDFKARTVLAALALLGAVLMREEGADLRSRCQLFPIHAFAWELLDKPGQPPATYTLDSGTARSIFKEAVLEAKKVDLPWEKTISLVPQANLLELVRRSQELEAQGDVEGE